MKKLALIAAAFLLTHNAFSTETNAPSPQPSKGSEQGTVTTEIAVPGQDWSENFVRLLPMVTSSIEKKTLSYEDFVKKIESAKIPVTYSTHYVDMLKSNIKDKEAVTKELKKVLHYIEQHKMETPDTQ